MVPNVKIVNINLKAVATNNNAIVFPAGSLIEKRNEFKTQIKHNFERVLA